MAEKNKTTVSIFGTEYVMVAEKSEDIYMILQLRLTKR